MPSKSECIEFLNQAFPQTPCQIMSVGERSAKITYPIGFDQLRPGGTVSGPTMMEAADVALYVAIMAEIGLEALAVTTSLSFNFLRKPRADQDIMAECTLLKVGKRLIVGEVSIFSEGEEEPVAHAVGSYSIPKQ